MSMQTGAYRFNSDRFAFEYFDDEIVVLNVVDGIYYAFRDAAVVAWPYLVGQSSEPEIAAALATAYEIPVASVVSDLAEFIGRLVTDNILLSAPASAVTIDLKKPLLKYAGFSFERHSEMEDLLTLDPIHDVDPQQGWPYSE